MAAESAASTLRISIDHSTREAWICSQPAEEREADEIVEISGVGICKTPGCTLPEYHAGLCTSQCVQSSRRGRTTCGTSGGGNGSGGAASASKAAGSSKAATTTSGGGGGAASATAPHDDKSLVGRRVRVLSALSGAWDDGVLTCLSEGPKRGRGASGKATYGVRLLASNSRSEVP